jgi:hypothetical protein
MQVYSEEQIAHVIKMQNWVRGFLTGMQQPHLPKIMTDIVSYLKKYQIEISDKIEGEGRGGSLKDEGTVKQVLQSSPFKEYIRDERARKFGDMIVLDYDQKTQHVVNIKTSEMKSADNCFSKVGIVYALTSLEPTSTELKPMNMDRMVSLIQQYKHDNKHKDYYFLCIDKADSSNILCRGAKQIAHWNVNINPSNILQINWKKEKATPPVDRTWDEAYDILVNGAKRSTFEFIKNLPVEWRDELGMSR